MLALVAERPLVKNRKWLSASALEKCCWPIVPCASLRAPTRNLIVSNVSLATVAVPATEVR